MQLLFPRFPVLILSAILCVAAHAGVADTGTSTNANILDLGTLGGRTSTGEAINNRGTIAGWSEVPRAPTGDVSHAAVYSNGSMTDLGTLSGAAGNSRAFGINDAGAVTGSSTAPNFATGEVFVARNGSLTGLGFEGAGFDINNAGAIVGQSQGQAFVYERGTLTNLGTLGGSQSQANAINEQRQIVGSAATASDEIHAVLFQNGTRTDLGTLGAPNPRAYEITSAYDINNLGQIVGSSNTQAFLYQNGTMTSLNLAQGPSTATAINDLGDIVGRMGVDIGFLIHDGTLIILNTLQSVIAAGWQSLSPYDINNRGDIIGAGINADGFMRSFIISSVPEPSTWLLLLLGLAGFVVVARRQAHG